MKDTPKIQMHNRDCMELMAEYPDNHFDLAIVDPPYGLGDKLKNGGDTGVVTFKYLYSGWDNNTPNKEYFIELFRVSKNQIIWGGNYFNLPPTRGVICWDKNIGSPLNFSHWEMGWTSFDCIARKVKINSNTGDRIHPTQKPVALYKWLLTNYAKGGDKILDTHGGSGSICLACHDLGFDLVWTELYPDYYADAVKRYEQHAAQLQMF